MSRFRCYEFLAMQLRIAMSFVDQRIQEMMLKSKTNQAFCVQRVAFQDNIRQLFNAGCATLDRIRTNADYQPVLVNLPKSQIIVLIFAYIKAARYGLFNFESVYKSYNGYIKMHEQ